MSVNRRGFLGSMVGGVVGAAAASGAAPAEAPPGTPIADENGMVKLALRISERVHQLMVEPRWTLLDVLRDHLGLTGTKLGCGRGECGACTVLIDDVPRYACLTLALEAEGTRVTTLEGLMRGEELGPVQQAFVEEDALQCGYCTPGQIMAVEGLLRKVPAPSLEHVREGVSGNLCRCGTYAHIFKAGLRAAELRRQGGR